MAHLLQVGAGSGGMPVLDMLCREPRITDVTLIEPDIYKPHNVERHLFALDAVGKAKAALAEEWLKGRRPELRVRVVQCDLLDPGAQAEINSTSSYAGAGFSSPAMSLMQIESEPISISRSAISTKSPIVCSGLIV